MPARQKHGRRKTFNEQIHRIAIDVLQVGTAHSNGHTARAYGNLKAVTKELKRLVKEMKPQ